MERMRVTQGHTARQWQSQEWCLGPMRDGGTVLPTMPRGREQDRALRPESHMVTRGGALAARKLVPGAQEQRVQGRELPARGGSLKV